MADLYDPDNNNCITPRLKRTSPWVQFCKENTGKGYAIPELQKRFTSSRKVKLTPWDRFVKQNVGKGYTLRELQHKFCDSFWSDMN